MVNTQERKKINEIRNAAIEEAKRINKNEEQPIHNPNYERVFVMKIRVNDLEKSIDWDLIREKKKEIKELRENLDKIRKIIFRIEEIYQREFLQELSEKQLADAYKEWANDPNEWKDIKAKY